MNRRNLLKTLLLAPLIKLLPKAETEAKPLPTKEEILALDTSPGEIFEVDNIRYDQSTFGTEGVFHVYYIMDEFGNQRKVEYSSGNWLTRNNPDDKIRL